MRGRARTEESVIESDSLFRLVANTAPVMIWMSGVDKLCTYFNQPWLDFTGRSVEAEMGNGWADGVHPDDLASCLQSYTRAFDLREPFRMTYRLRRHDGEYRWILDQGVPRFDVDGSFAGYIGSCVDVTEQKLAEEALSTMSQKLIEAQEEERCCLARELHDDINQRVGLLAVSLECLKKDLPAGKAALRRRVAREYERASKLASDIQMLSHRLHSSHLEYMGLAGAAKGFCQELIDLEKISVDFHADELPKQLPRTTALCLFRVLQEALRNAVKHSGSKRFQVTISVLWNQIELTLRDWGKGFEPGQAVGGRGLGLISMQERMKLVGGQLSVQSKLGAGTTVRATVPIDPAAEPSPQ